MANHTPYTKPVLIFGCGNMLFGDDGFGPAVIEHLLNHYQLPESVSAIDAGTGIRDFLFDFLLSPSKPDQIYIVDAASLPDRKPGELFEIKLDQIPAVKACDFSLHQFPSVNLLSELDGSTGISIHILVVQTMKIPACVQPGLSPEIQSAVDPACRWLLSRVGATDEIINEG